jgi:hypothetical protein
MFEHFYHEIFRRTIISFGSLFNNMLIKQENSSEETVNQFRVPLSYGPTQKFLARLSQSPDLNKSVAMTLPRMSFEFTGLQYDPSRKVTQTQKFSKGLSSDKKSTQKAYMPVPYNMQFELAIMTKLNDDMLQIVEQILPYFQPSYNLSVNLIDTIGEKRDIPVVLESITTNDDYEGDFSTRRALIYTLRFSVKTYLFGPISSASSDIITKATLGYIAGNQSTVPDRDVSYSVQRRALKNYDGTVLTTLTDDIEKSDTVIPVASVAGITDATYLDLDGEEVYVKSIGTDSIVVSRGQDGTTITTHLRGAEIKSITSADADLILDGDDFGFDGSFS